MMRVFNRLLIAPLSEWSDECEGNFIQKAVPNRRKWFVSWSPSFGEDTTVKNKREAVITWALRRSGIRGS